MQRELEKLWARSPLPQEIRDVVVGMVAAEELVATVALADELRTYLDRCIGLNAIDRRNAHAGTALETNAVQHRPQINVGGLPPLNVPAARPTRGQASEDSLVAVGAVGEVSDAGDVILSRSRKTTQTTENDR